ncbi:MAG: hypothetical protein P1U50_00925 [Parvibaculaceae bacterium]|nr:hypothetical protein [Parvibaculaceae bacterium]
MSQVATIGHNNPPSPMEQVQANYDDTFIEVGNWADGSEVENEQQLSAVEELVKQIKAATKDAKAAKEQEYRPHKEAGDAVVAEWKPFLEDLDRQRRCLLAAIDPYKKKLAAAKAEKERLAREEAERIAHEAQQAALAARESSDLEAARAAQEKADEAAKAKKLANKAGRDTVKGMRTIRTPNITDPRACINWINTNDKPALQAFMDDYVRRAVREGRLNIDGVEVIESKEVF